MSPLSATVRVPAIISVVLLLPFAALELINGKSFPFVLFFVMWLLPFAFILVMMPIIHSRFMARCKGRLHVVGLFLRVAFLMLIGWMWVHLIVDQMPCFMGVPNCD